MVSKISTMMIDLLRDNFIRYMGSLILCLYMKIVQDNITEQYNLVRTQNYFDHKIFEICQKLVIAFLGIFNMSPFKFYFIMFILFVTTILK